MALRESEDKKIHLFYPSLGNERKGNESNGSPPILLGLRREQMVENLREKGSESGAVKSAWKEVPPGKYHLRI